MRRATWSAAVAVLLLSPLAARAEDDKEARAVIDRAVKALGGAEKLAPLQGVTFRTKGQVTVNDFKADLSGDAAVQGQERYRWSLEISAMGRTESGVLILDGDKGWTRGDGQQKANDIPKDFVPMLRADFGAFRVAQQLTPLLDKEVKLSHLGEMKINEQQPAVGVKVTRKDMPDLDFWFDKQTGLPLRVQFRVKEGDQGTETDHAYDFADFKEFNGVKQFTKVTLRRDDKPMMELELSDFQLSEKVDDSLFAKP